MGPSPLFWILALVLVAAIPALLVVPLLRRARAEAGPADVEAATAVFRDHKRQLDAELAAGAVTNDEHAAAVAELTRRFGAELESAAPAPVAAGPGRGGFTAALALVALLPVTAGVLYFVLGNPAALAPQTARQGPADEPDEDDVVRQGAPGRGLRQHRVLEPEPPRGDPAQRRGVLKRRSRAAQPSWSSRNDPAMMATGDGPE